MKETVDKAEYDLHMNHSDSDCDIDCDIEQNRERLQALKDEYHTPRMSAEQLENLKQCMTEAKRENKAARIKRRNRSIMTTLVASIMLVVLLPNLSPGAAYAMEQVPILRQIVALVTVRNYHYETERNKLNIDVPHFVVNGNESESLTIATDAVNQEIARITEQIAAEFRESLNEEEGRQDIRVTGHVLATTEEYITLKLSCSHDTGSGSQWNYYFTIDLQSEKQLCLQDLFQDGADYMTPINDSIKAQMQTQMAADDTVMYYLDSKVEAWNFKTITDETHFYVNESDNIVIGFDEGQVAPRYMGAVEFEIPADAVAHIRK